MSWLLDSAVKMNGGRRRDALVVLAEKLDVHVETIRLWERNGAPKHVEIGINALCKLSEIEAKLLKVKDILHD